METIAELFERKRREERRKLASVHKGLDEIFNRDVELDEADKFKRAMGM